MGKAKSKSRLIQEINVADFDGGVIFGEQGKKEVLKFCDLLNSDKDVELARELQKLIDAWLESGQNLEKLTNANPELRRSLDKSGKINWRPAANGSAALILRFDFGELAKAIGDERVSNVDLEGEWAPSPEAEALKAFFFFTLNANCEDLVGRCDRCKNYFVRGRRNNKRYCSRKCASAFTAEDSTRKRVEGELAARLKVAESAIRRWNGLKSNRGRNFGAWLKHYELSKNFVTRHKRELPKVKGAK